MLDGMPFEDALISFPDAIPCGVKVASCGGKIIMNPEDSYILQEGDEILVIAEDDDSYTPAELPMVLSFSSRNKDFKQISWFIVLAYSVCCIKYSTCVM